MAEVNLIPVDYERYLTQRRSLKKFTFFFLFLLLSLLLSRAWLDLKIREETQSAEQLKYGERVVLAKRQQLETLNREKTLLLKRVKKIEALKGGPSAGKMFVAVDSALNKEVWFTEWKFLRTGEISREKLPKVEKKGYFVVVPKDNPGEEELKEFTRMDIKGKAVQYSALASFIKGLLKQPEVEDVTVKKTGKQKEGEVSVISFELSVLIKTS